IARRSRVRRRASRDSLRLAAGVLALWPRPDPGHGRHVRRDVRSRYDLPVLTAARSAAHAAAPARVYIASACAGCAGAAPYRAEMRLSSLRLASLGAVLAALAGCDDRPGWIHTVAEVPACASCRPGHLRAAVWGRHLG